MSTYKPAQIFASISATPPLKEEKKKEVAKEKVAPMSRENEIQVSSSGEVSVPPDRCRVTISVYSVKEQAQEAKNSVFRRVDYILQTLANHQIREENIDSSKVLQKIDGMFHYNVETTVIFGEYNKCQSVCNFLVEKLDDSVRVTPPDFLHSPQQLENARRQASLLAVKNARQKAAEIAQFIHAKVGEPISLREEYSNEWHGSTEGPLELDGPLTMQQRIEHATFHAVVKVSTTFLLKPKRTKENVPT